MTASSFKILGCMLWPCARNRTLAPRSRSASHTAPNCAEFLFSMVLRFRTTDGLHRRFIRNKSENGTRHFLNHTIQKFQREADAFARMVRRKSTAEQFRRCDARRKRKPLIAFSARQQVNTGKWRALRRSNASIAMPRRAVHPNLAVACAQNDAVVAENAYARAIEPQACGRALPGSRMTEEQMSASILVRNSDRMHFHAFAARKAVNHEQLIKRVLERVGRPLRIKIAA